MDKPSNPAVSHRVTELLQAWGTGQQEALHQLIPLVREELHRLAQWHMRKERAGHTLQPTALVNEAYLRLVDLHRVRWQDRAHFFAMSARLMRHILVNVALSKGCRKRGGPASGRCRSTRRSSCRTNGAKTSWPWTMR
jgi:RNA polymerase sigma factor (TIGR02999 family)